MASFDVVETHLLAFGSFATYLALGLTVDRDKALATSFAISDYVVTIIRVQSAKLLDVGVDKIDQ